MTGNRSISNASGPSSINAATGRYKRATKQLSRFINDNGGDTGKIAGWEWAPHDVLRFTGGVIPEDIWATLEDAIADREYVAQHYGDTRLRNGDEYTNADIGHLRFLEVLKIIREVWSGYVENRPDPVEDDGELDGSIPRSSGDDESDLSEVDPCEALHIDDEERSSLLSCLAYDYRMYLRSEEPPRSSFAIRPDAGLVNPVPLLDKRDVASDPGELDTFIVFTESEEVLIFPRDLRPPFEVPILWRSQDGFADLKFELRRYFGNGWPFVLYIHSSHGVQHYFSWEKEVEDFATIDPAKWPVSNWSVEANPYIASETTINTPEDKREPFLRWTAKQKQCAESHKSRERALHPAWWYLLNSVRPKDRHYIMELAPGLTKYWQSMTVWPVGSKEYLTCDESEAKVLVNMLCARGDQISFLPNRDKLSEVALLPAVNGMFHEVPYWLDFYRSWSVDWSRGAEHCVRLLELCKKKGELLKYCQDHSATAA